MDQSKTCSRCRVAKPLDQFGPSKQTPDGLFRYCRVCKRASDRASHAKHKPSRNASMREQYRRKADEYKARDKKWYAANRERKKATVVAWMHANPERRREIRQASFKRQWNADPERFREVWRRRQAAVRRGCAVYPFAKEQLAAKVAYWGGRCWVCGTDYDAIDHVKPLAKQGPHMLANLRPICTPCNTRKRDRWPLLAA